MESSSARSVERTGMPPRSSASSTFVAASSWGSVMPTASNDASGAQPSIENSGSPASRSASHRSGAGTKPRSAAMPGRALTAFTSILSAWFACPSS